MAFIQKPLGSQQAKTGEKNRPGRAAGVSSRQCVHDFRLTLNGGQAGAQSTVCAVFDLSTVPAFGNACFQSTHIAASTAGAWIREEADWAHSRLVQWAPLLCGISRCQ